MTTRKLMVAGGLAAIWLVLALASSALTAVTGIPGMSGLIGAVTSTIMFVFCCLLLQVFGCATIMAFVFGFCALPLPTIGTPGFLPKIIIAVFAGFLADCVFALLKKKERIAAIAIGIVTQPVIGLGIAVFGLLFGMPGIEKMTKIFFSVPALALISILGAIGGYIGYIVFNKLRNTSVVKRIQAK